MAIASPVDPLVLPDDPYNRELTGHVHPLDWTNPRPDGRYNLVVVGAGTAGLVTAIGSARLGARVALVERHLMGGDCLNYGCVPSKALIRSARAAYAVKESGSFGVRLEGEHSVDFGMVMGRLRQLRAGIARHDSARRFSDAGVDVYLGQGTFASRDSLEVGGQTLCFAKAVIATGARATAIPIPGLEEAGFLTNETLFSLTELPRRLVVIGAGPIGCEMAQSFRRFGSEVTIVSLDDRLLPREDPDASTILARQFERENIELRLGAKLKRVERRDDERVVAFERDGFTEEVLCDEVLLAVGRAPNVEGLGLDKAGVRHDRTGVLVDDRLRTSNPRIFAAGDICSSYKFTHAADALARIAIRNALFAGRASVDDLVIPWSTYTTPEVAHVGLTAREAASRGDAVKTYTVELSGVDRAVLDGEKDGFARFHVDARKGRLLGATIVAQNAGDLISEASFAITHRLKASSFSSVIHPYPTQSEAWKRLGDMVARGRLTPMVGKILSRVLAWRR